MRMHYEVTVAHESCTAIYGGLNRKQQEHCMDRIKRNPGLEAIYARLDEIHMSPADRLNARAALAQADALVDFILGAVDLAKRVLRIRALRPTSAHG